MSGRSSWRVAGSLVAILIRGRCTVGRGAVIRSGRGLRLLATIRIWRPRGMANRCMSWCDVARGSCWCPARIGCNTAPESFVLGLIQVSDLERVAQFWDTRCGCIKQIVRFRGDADGLLETEC